MKLPSLSVILGALLVLTIATAALRDGCSRRSFAEERARLLSQVAERDKTIETQKGVFERRSIASEEALRVSVERLASADERIRTLDDELKRRGEQLVSANSLTLKWKKDYEGLVAATQTDAPPATPGGPPRRRVDFSKDWGMIGVSGHTLTDPAEAYVSVKQLRPLRLTLFVSEGRDGVWTARAVSSEDDIGVDIDMSTVSPRLPPRTFFERLGVTLHAFVGPSVLVGVGLSYDIGRFEFGPAALTSTNGEKFFGASLLWRPFNREGR